jgi:hypothetical protein
MTNYWKRSRVTKALTDAARAGSFSEAEARLDAVQVAVTVGEDQLGTIKLGNAAQERGRGGQDRQESGQGRVN